jgi:hypothetical protein
VTADAVRTINDKDFPTRMRLRMKRLVGLLVFAGVLGTMSGCSSYAGAAASGDKVVVASNNGFLFGVFRKVYVCKVTEKGLASCGANENP